jgi:hypothetical protein
VRASEAPDQTSAAAPVNLKLERLPAVARGHRARVPLPRLVEPLAPERRARGPLHPREEFFDARRAAALAHFEHERAALALYNVCA